jgi:molybdate transport system ATP-binding protein
MLRVDLDTDVGTFHLRPRFEANHELVVLFGPSGCGKSLTLSAVAGLLRPRAGRIELPNGVVAFDSSRRIDLPPQARSAGYLVQDLALFPHMSVADNISFAIAGWPAQRRRERLAHLIEQFGLQGLEKRKPGEVSGGQQQRVALARALAAEPSLLLLDEPFTALDAPIRTKLRREVSDLRRRLDLTVLFVTHDLSEAYSIADRIVVYDDGQVLQSGPREEVFRRPVSRRVAELTEVRNIIPGTIRAFAEGVALVETPWFTVRVQDDASILRGDVFLCIRPEHIIVLREGHEPRESEDTVVETEIIDEDATANSHRLFMRTVAPQGSAGEPFIFEADVPAHPYQVLGIASRRVWRLALSPEWMSVVPRDA